MRRSATPSSARSLFAILALVATLAGAPAAHAAVVSYWGMLDGASESPPVATAGIGTAQVDLDAAAHTMRVRVHFSDLTGLSTVCHIHGPTAVAGTGLATVATTSPSFAGFPSGVTGGTYDHTLDMTQASSYHPGFLSARGGNVSLAESDLFAAIDAGKTYVNVHSDLYSSGEIRGFLNLLDPTPATPASWGRIKQLYR